MLALNPAVELRNPSADGFELYDRRTGLSLAFEGCPASRLEALAGSAELFETLRDLCLLNDGSSIDEARRRQYEWRVRASADELAASLGALVEFATERVPFYRKRKETYALENASMSALQALPILSKSTLREHFEELLPDGESLSERIAAGDWELVSTSGTTEDRLTAIADMNLSRFPDDFEEALGLEHSPRPRRTAVITAPGCMGSAGCAVSTLSRAERTKKEHTIFVPTPEDLFSVEDDGIRRMVDELWEIAPDWLLVNPVYAHWIGRRALALGLELPKVELVLSTYQYASKLQRAALERTFGAPVRSMYSATELGGCQIGLECHAGHLHAREDHCVVELVNRRVVVTTHASRSTPLFRYAPGDLADFSGVQCTCPMQAWPVLVLHGRLQETLRLDSELITTRDLDEAVTQIEGIDFYRCSEQRGGELVFELIPAIGMALDADRVRRELRDRLPGATVDARIVRRLDPAPSLKFPLLAPYRPDHVGPA